MHIKVNVDIPASSDSLWELLTDPDEIMRWTPAIKKIASDRKGPPEPGQKSIMTMQEGSKLVQYDSEILNVSNKEMLTLQLAGGSLGKHPMTVRYKLSVQPEGTVVEYTADWKPSSYLILLAPLITWMSKRNARHQMECLKNAATTRAPKA